MPLRVLIIPDKFKGTLTAPAAAEAIAKGWAKVRPEDVLDLLPMSDGGDGFGEVMSLLQHARACRVKTVDAAHRPCTSRWWHAKNTGTAIVESANVVGLAMMPRGRFHPFQLDTFGLGAVLRAAAAREPSRCVLGIGGSATNDGGFGLARALDWQFLDANGHAIEHWTELDRLVRIRTPKRRQWFKRLVVAVDVRNPLLGPRGATRIYGPQKGIQADEFKKAEQCLKHLAHVFRDELGADYASDPGAGAAGGLGFGLRAFAGGQLEPGFEIFARYARLEERLKRADLLLTGEGSIDRSTEMGKGVGQVASLCRDAGLPVIGLAGVVKLRPKATRLFARTLALTQLTTVENATRNAGLWLERLAAKAAAEIASVG